jgi:hypothetical protein
MHTNSDLNFFCHTTPFFSVQTKTANSPLALQCISTFKRRDKFLFLKHSTGILCNISRWGVKMSFRSQLNQEF